MTDLEKEKMFAELVQYSHTKYDEAFRHQRIDDVLVGSVIASMVKSGYSLIGLNSDGTNHHLRFENLRDRTRLLFRLTHLSESLTAAKVQGHLGCVVVGYGERPENLARLMEELADETSNLFAPLTEPGVVSFAFDPSSGYAYVQILLVLELDRYIGQDFKVELTLFQSHFDSVVFALRKILRGRLPAAA